MSNELIKVPFREGEILAVKDERGEWVVIRPLCEQLGLDPRAQQRRIERSAWGPQGAAIMAVPSAGGEQQTFVLHRKRIAMWLATLEVKRVKEPARPYLAQLQEEAADVLDAYFSSKAPAPAVPEPTDSMDLVIQQSAQIVAVARRLQEQDRRIASVETKVLQIEAAQAEATAEMLTVERAEGHAPGLTTRAKVVRLHRAYCVAKPADFQEAWNWLYTELKYRHNFDAKIRAKNRKCKALDVIEQDGMMEVFFVLASDLLVVREAAA